MTDADNERRFDVNLDAHPDAAGEEVDPMLLGRDVTATSLARLAAGAAVPGLTGSALSRRFGPRSSWFPRTGQIWRSVRHDVTLLVLLVEVQRDSVTIVPVTIGSDARPDVVILDGTGFGVPVSVWTTLVRSLPTSVLDGPVDEVDPTTAFPLLDVDAAAGTKNLEPIDEYAAELLDDLELLVEVATPVDTDATAQGSGGAGIDVASLTPDVLNDAARRVGVPLPRLLELIDGELAPTPGQTRTLQEVFGAVPVLAPLPVELISELSQPRWRALVRGRRGQDEPTEETARTALAYEVRAMAARQTGDRAPSWPDRIRRWAEVHQLDPDAEK
ncbi:MAG: hypothetical protein ACRDRH_13980 [Pseudonocardia sp.]